MARPRKEGLDYFSHDTDAAGDEKVEALRAIYGNDGYAFYFILLERIYRTPGGELEVSDAETIQILANKVAVTPERFNQMLQTALKRECFDPKIYAERAVLTSDGIKKRMAPVLEKRCKMRGEDVSDAETMQKRGRNAAETTQSKGKESKEYTLAFEAFWSHYPRKNEKIAAFLKWKARIKEGVKESDLIAAAKNYAADCVGNGTERKFTKQAKAFLGHTKPYEDWIKPPAGDSQGADSQAQATACMSEYSTSICPAKKEGRLVYPYCELCTYGQEVASAYVLEGAGG
ncbi:MAG: DUF4373 domain-containing protein [Candidatus Aquicultorales bacterium]